MSAGPKPAPPPPPREHHSRRALTQTIAADLFDRRAGPSGSLLAMPQIRLFAWHTTFAICSGMRQNARQRNKDLWSSDRGPGGGPRKLNVFYFVQDSRDILLPAIPFASGLVPRTLMVEPLAAARPAPEPHGEEPQPIAARSRPPRSLSGDPTVRRRCRLSPEHAMSDHSCEV
jgi:hypothetical protein